MLVQPRNFGAATYVVITKNLEMRPLQQTLNSNNLKAKKLIAKCVSFVN